MSQSNPADALPTQRRLTAIYDAQQNATAAVQNYQQSQAANMDLGDPDTALEYQTIESHLMAAVYTYGDEVMPLLIRMGDSLETDYWEGVTLGENAPPELDGAWRYVRPSDDPGAEWEVYEPDPRPLNGLKSVLKFEPRRFTKQRHSTGMIHPYTERQTVEESINPGIWMAVKRCLDHFVQESGLGVKLQQQGRPLRRIGDEGRWQDDAAPPGR